MPSDVNLDMSTGILNNSMITEEPLEGSIGGPYMVEKIVGVRTVGKVGGIPIILYLI